jgi:uncharacterized membrane protein YcfT
MPSLSQIKPRRTWSASRDRTFTPVAEAASQDRAAGRIAWFDYAKGLCIILVVMMHSTLGVGEAMGGEGWMHQVVAFAKPFRMPDFFLLSGLFLSQTIDRDWRTYFDRKVIHFAYFYALWTIIQCGLKSGIVVFSSPSAFVAHFGHALISPYPTLWFLYVLPLFFVATKLLRRMPAWALLGLGVVLTIVPMHTGWDAFDDYAAHYFIFFLAGYLLAPLAHGIAAWAREHVWTALGVIVFWGLLNGALAFTASGVAQFETLASLPLISIVIGLMGAFAIVAVAALMAKFEIAKIVRTAGQNSIVIYCCFVLPMAATRIVLVKSGIFHDVAFVSQAVMGVALLAPLVLHALIRQTPLRFLFERPAALVWASRGKPAARPAARMGRTIAPDRLRLALGSR